MESNGLYGSSTHHGSRNPTRNHRAANKVGEGFGKAKAVASTGIKKVKEGTSTSLQWIKDKCHKPSHKSGFDDHA